MLVLNSAQYPHEAVRHAAADVTREIAARHLRDASGPELDHLLEALRRLVPADRLLERDTSRYFRVRTQPPRPTAGSARKTVPQPQNTAELTRLNSFELPGNLTWQCAISCGDRFYAVTRGGHRLRIACGSWDGSSSWNSWRGIEETVPILLACDPRGQTVILHACGRPPLAMITFSASQNIPTEFQVGTPEWMPDGAVGIQLPGNGFKHVLVKTEDGMALQTRDAEGRPLRSQLLAFQSLWPDRDISHLPVVPVPMCARGKGIYVGIGNRLVLVAGGKTLQILNVPGIVRGLCGSTPNSVERIVATLEEGALLIWEGGQTMARFAGLNHPVATFTASGWIVLASGEEVQVFKTEGRKIELVARQARSVQPVAVLPAAHPDRFAVVGQDGTVEIYQMSRR